MAIKPYARPDVRPQDLEAVLEVLKSQFLTTGPKVPELEELFTNITRAPEAVACSNGTTALHLACLALGLKPGDWVIVPAMTFLATANAVRMCGAHVIFSDVDADTGLLTPDLLLQTAAHHADKNIRAVFPVHIGGHSVDMKAVSEIARSKGWFVVEDACHALGGTTQGAAVGSCACSDLSTFSLHATKSFTTCEGGMVTTKNPDWAERMRRLRNHGINREGGFLLEDLAHDASGVKNPWYAEMAELGYNYRLSDVQAALGICQLARVDEVRTKRMSIATKYTEALADLEPFLRPVPPSNNGDPLLHLYQVLIDFDRLEKTKVQVCQQLMEHGVGTQVHYMPVAWQPYYVDLYGPADLPGAKAFYERVLALPLYSSLSDDDVEAVINGVQSVFTQ